MKKFLGFLITIVLAFSSFTQSTFAATDISNHWAKSQLESWLSKGYISEYSDGTLKPDSIVTRAEFFAMVNSAFGYTQKSSINFSDVNVNEWQYSVISTAVAAGYISGTGDGKISPNRDITREEAAVIILKVTGLTPYEPGSYAFTDIDAAGWSKPYIGAVVASGIMNGYSDSTFRPNNTVTRAEAVVSLNSALNYKLTKAGAYVAPLEGQMAQVTVSSDPISSSSSSSSASSSGPSEDDFSNFALTITGSYSSSRNDGDVNGDVQVNVNSSTIRDLDIDGDVVLTSKCKGTITFEDVYISGTLYIFGSPTVVFKSSEAEGIIVNGLPTTKITMRSQSVVEEVRLYSAATLVESSLNSSYSGFEDVIIESDMKSNAKVTLTGDFENVDVLSSRIKFYLSSGEIENLNIEEEAERGTYNISSSSTVYNLDVYGKYSTFTGSGTIEYANVDAKNVTFQYDPEEVDGDYGSNSGSSSDNDEYTVGIYVKTEDDRDPIKSATVYIYDDDGDRVAYGNTNTKGFVDFDLEYGTYEATAYKSGYAYNSTTVQARSTSRNYTIYLTESSSLASLLYTVYDGSNSNALLEGAVVTLYNSTAGYVTRSTNANGIISVSNLPAGSYSVTTAKAGYETANKTITLSEGSNTNSEALTLSSVSTQGAALTYTVKNSDNVALTGAKVELVNLEGTTFMKTTSSGTAVFSNLETGTYSVTVSLSGYVDETDSIALTAGSNTKTATLDPVRDNLAIVVKDTATAALEDALVEIELTSSAMTYIDSATTNSTGEASFSNIPVGVYKVTVTLSGYSDQVYTLVAVNAGGSNVLNVALTQFFTTLTYTVLDGESSSAPLANATVGLVNVYTGATFTGITGVNGEAAVISNLPYGNYDVTITASGYNTNISSIIHINGAVSTGSITVNY